MNTVNLTGRMPDTLDRWIEDIRREFAVFAEEEKPYAVITRKGHLTLI